MILKRMKIGTCLQGPAPVFSFEFFPPKTDEGVEKLYARIEHLAELAPAFVSVTYGAGGSTRDRTVEIAAHIKHHIGLETMAHLTCLGHKREELANTLVALERAGIENVLALRGDPPLDGVQAPSDFKYANELIEFVREGHEFCIGGAAYPEGHIEASDLDSDLMYLEGKVNSGAAFLITQLFFDNSAYFDFMRRVRARGISVPILPGIMPITNVAQLEKFTSMCGAKIPRTLMEKLEKVRGDEQAVTAVGIEWAIRQCRELLALGAPGIHFYTINRSLSTRVVCMSLQYAGFGHMARMSVG